MIQKTVRINDIRELEATEDMIRSGGCCRASSVRVLLVWATLFESEFDELREEVHRLFPDFTVIGTNCFSSRDILEGRIDGKGADREITLSFFFFEGSGVQFVDIASGIGSEEETGLRVNEVLSSVKELKGVYMVLPNYFCSAEAIVRKALPALGTAPLFGIKTCILPGYRVFGYAGGGELVTDRLFLLIFHGSGLDIRVHYNLGWTPVGKVMTVTAEENPFFVDEIDGRPATEVYNRYLGLENDQIIPVNLSEFPLILFRDDMKVSRIGIAGPKPGQLVFGAPVNKDDRICLSYGNPDELFSEIEEDCREIEAMRPEAGMIITCANRLMLLKEREQDEIAAYRRYMREAPAVYGYAEIYYMDGKGGEMNSALISVSMRENTSKKTPAETQDNIIRIPREASASDSDDSPVTASLEVPFIDRLSRFFKEMSADLMEAVSEAETANREKSAFFSCVSHEFRTPLNAILGMNEMIMRESTEPAIREYARNAENSGKLLLQLVNDILDTEKIEAGRMEIVPVTYSLKEMTGDLMGMVALSAEAKGLKLSFRDSGTEADMLVGDETRLRQIILNLLNNAVKYTPGGEIVFSVDCRRIDEKQARLTVSVRDTGIGIKKEDMDRLSQPFSRLDQKKNRGIEGSGLGLNIVRRLLELMGASLQIESVYGEGSVFSFSVVQGIGEGRLHEDAAGEPETSRDSVETVEGPAERKAEGKILVVDDNPMNLKVMKFFLKDTGIRVDTAHDGASALPMIEKESYDIIFLDNLMPGMDGLTVFHRIKEDKDSKNADSVFVMLTGTDGKEEEERFLSEGFDGFLTKPLKIEELKKFLKKHGL